MLTITSRVIATCFALTSFASALFVGAAAGNPFNTVLLRAVFIMVGCYVVGLVIGGIAQYTVDRHIETYKRENPIPETHGRHAAQHPETSALGGANQTAV
ncbi:MAG: hypothetical protein AAF333_12585 [Planctomycetota bacterium]